MLAQRQPLVASLRRDAWVEVDLNAIERNVQVVRSWLAPGTRLMAVVKSDAYGHGAAGVAEVLVASGAEWLGVASVDEGTQLRCVGIKHPILLLSPCPAWALPTALDADLTLTVTSKEQIRDLSLSCQRQNRTAAIHLKVDTGMHRLGVRTEDLDEVLTTLEISSPVRLAGVFTHLACPDKQEFTDYQTQNFKQAIARVKARGFEPSLIHMASGEAARRFPHTHLDMVRVGLYLYGLEPRNVSDAVTPAMSVRGRINHIQRLQPGDRAGYGLTWTADRASRLASIPIGYADGVDRGLSNRIQGLLHGKKVPQVGLISMDQMLFDVTAVPEAQESDVITLIGSDPESQTSLDLAFWAGELDTITYELCCRLRARMPRVYTRQESSRL